MLAVYYHNNNNNNNNNDCMNMTLFFTCTLLIKLVDMLNEATFDTNCLYDHSDDQ